MKDTQIHAQYSTGLSRRNIEQALVAAGKDLNHLQPADLGLLEDFHTIWPLPTSCALSWSPPGSRSSTGNDLSDQAASTMQMFLTLPPNPLGLHAFVPDFAEKAQNLTVALTDGRLRAIQAVAHAITH